jgi:Flp pilus assembly protein TadD
VALLILISGAVVFSGCAKKKSVLRRMVIGPANVLIGDPAAEWMKVGVPLVLRQDLMSAQFTAPAMVNDEANAAQLGAQDILRLKIEDRQGKIHITATEVDAATQKQTGSYEVEASSAATLIPAIDKLAKELDQTAGEFSSKNTEAVKLLTSFGVEQNAQKRLEILKKAIAIDPNFGMCYSLLLQMEAPMGPENYNGLLAEAKSHSANFAPYDRARLQLLELQLARAPMNQRVAAVEALLKVAPNDVDGLSIMAGMRFLNGDANGGVAAIDKAIELNPGNANLKGQLAEGLVQSKRFAEAEKVLATFDKNPAALAELATTILLEGDVKRATATAEQFIATVPNPDYQAILQATWSELSGDRTKALELAEGAKFTNPQIRGMALSEATVWRLMNKDFAGARRTADLAVQSDNHPTAITLVASLLVSGDQTAEEWRKKVDASPINAAMKQPILAYGFFLNGHYNEAVVEWRKAYEASEGTDLRVRTMLAASLDRAGKTAEAQKIKVEPFLIRDFADVYGAVAFSEMRRLAGLVR